MRLRRTLVGLGLLALASGCAHGESALHGSYVAHDTGLDEFRPPVTLVLAPSHRFRFCVGTTCSSGRWSVQQVAQNGHGRIVLNGTEVEKWMRDFNISAYHSGNPEWLDVLDGSAEADYDVVLGMTSITLGAGDAAFVKR